MDLEALLRAVRDGQPGAWNALHPSLHRRLLGYFRREFDEATASELTQRTMEVLTRTLPGFVPRKGALRPWAFGIARNQGRLEHRARAQRDKALNKLAALIIENPNTSPSARLRAEELRAILREEIERLPSRLRRVIEHDLQSAYLATLDRLQSLEEFTKREGIRPGTVWSRRSQAIKMLRDRLMVRLSSRQPRPMAAGSSTSSSSSPPG